MSNYTLRRSYNTIEDVLSSIISKYENEQRVELDTADDVLHRHSKNPDGKYQIKLLKKLADLIKQHVPTAEQNIAELGTLLVLKALFTDPNRNGNIFSFLVKELGLDKAIHTVLHRIKPNVPMDLTNREFLRTSQEAFNVCSELIEHVFSKERFPHKFVKDLRGTIATELDYINRVVDTLRHSYK